MRQNYMVIEGEKYERGTVFVIKWHDGIAFTERRIIFFEYDTDTKRYCFITPTSGNAEQCTSYPDTRFMNSLIRIESPTEREIRTLNSVIQRKTRQRRAAKIKPNDQHVLLLILGVLVLFALLPPLGAVVFFCIVFSDGTLSGFMGCLTPILILVGLALITMLFH